MELTTEHKKRALEIFESFLQMNKEIEDVQSKLKNLVDVQTNLVERVNQLRESEEIWVKKIAEELNLSEKEVNLMIANFVMTERNLNISL